MLSQNPHITGNFLNILKYNLIDVRVQLKNHVSLQGYEVKTISVADYG